MGITKRFFKTNSIILRTWLLKGRARLCGSWTRPNYLLTAVRRRAWCGAFVALSFCAVASADPKASSRRADGLERHSCLASAAAVRLMLSCISLVWCRGSFFTLRAHQTGLAAPVSLIPLGCEHVFFVCFFFYTCTRGDLTLLFLSAGNAGGEGADHASADSQA